MTGARRLAPLLVWPLLACSSVSPAPPAGPDQASPTVASAPVTLRWTVRNLDQIHAFLVYRSASAEGPFRRINPQLVLAAEPVASDESGSRYQYVDGTAEPGTRYFYYVDLVSAGGVKMRLTGVIEKVAPPAPTGASPAPP